MSKIYHNQAINGVTTPAIIHNFNYYYINMPVYENGIVDCWGRYLLSELKSVVDGEKLVTQVPVGKDLSVHALGQYKIVSAVWEHTPRSFVKYIKSVVKSMNFHMVGIYEETEEHRELCNKQRVEFSANGVPFRLGAEYGYDRIEGKQLSILYKNGDVWQLTSLIVYSDKTISVDALGDTLYSIDDIKEMFEKDILGTGPRGVFTISMPGLGKISCEVNGVVDSDEKYKEVEELVGRLSGEESLHEVCRKAYYRYLSNPSNFNKEALRDAYEALPSHTRIYLGDMDTRDTDYKRILYTEEKREV